MLSTTFQIGRAHGIDAGVGFHAPLQVQDRSENSQPGIRKLPKNPFFAFVAMEFFINLNDAIEERYVNRSRLTFRLGNHVAKTWRVEIEFIRQGSKRDSEEGFKASEYMLRFRIKHDLKSRFFVF